VKKAVDLHQSNATLKAYAKRILANLAIVAPIRPALREELYLLTHPAATRRVLCTYENQETGEVYVEVLCVQPDGSERLVDHTHVSPVGSVAVPPKVDATGKVHTVTGGKAAVDAYTARMRDVSSMDDTVNNDDSSLAACDPTPGRRDLTMDAEPYMPDKAAVGEIQIDEVELSVVMDTEESS
jgi:hypothetical protein